MDHSLEYVMAKTCEISGWFYKKQIQALYTFLDLHALPRGIIIEIGTYLGRSTRFWSLVAPNHYILTIDSLEPGVFDGIRYPKSEILPEVLLNGNITQILERSCSVARLFHWPIALLFIDGGHHSDSVLSDLEAWTPHLIDGGVLVLHDYCHYHAGVEMAWKDWTKNNDHGLGVFIQDHDLQLLVAIKDKMPKREEKTSFGL